MKVPAQQKKRITFWGNTFEVWYSDYEADQTVGIWAETVVNRVWLGGFDIIDFLSRAVIEGLIVEIQKGEGLPV